MSEHELEEYPRFTSVNEQYPDTSAQQQSKRNRVRMVAVLTTVAVCAATVSYGVGAAMFKQSDPVPVIEAAQETQTPRAIPQQVQPVRIRTCLADAQAGDSRLGNLSAYVLNAQTMEPLFDRNGLTAGPPASGMKTLTAAASLAVLGPDYRLTTRVVAGAEPGEIIVLGGGDVTLSRLGPGGQSFYSGAPKIQDLVAQTKQALGDQPITRIHVDDSLFAGPVWHPTWDERQERIVEGSTSYVTALQVDGDRENPAAAESPRSTDPVGRAMDAFQGFAGTRMSVDRLVAPSNAVVLGQVHSQPASTLIEQAMKTSDNTIMETLARHVAIALGVGNTFDAINPAFQQALARYGMDTSGMTIADGSGLSAANAVTPDFFARFFVQVFTGENYLGDIRDALPVSGVSGTLSSAYGRFTGPNAVARGAVRAKTGWIDNAYTLSGIIDAQDGTVLTFAVYALGPVTNSAKEAIDSLVTRFYECGDTLSNW